MLQVQKASIKLYEDHFKSYQAQVLPYCLLKALLLRVRNQANF